MILKVLRDYIWSDELRNHGRMDKTHFIRERILTFPVLVMFLINLAKKSLQVSLNEFCKVGDLLNVTKQAFSKARKKLSFQTFILLNRRLIEEFYSDNVVETWKGFRLLGVDGTDLQLPQTESLKTIYGTAKNQTGPTLAMAKVSYAYDILNKITLDAQIDYCKASERDLAVRHIEAIKQLKHDKTNDLYIFDRGYPSLGLLFYFAEQKRDFLFRSNVSTCFGTVKKIIEQGKEDVIIRLHSRDANDDQIKELKKRTPSLDRKNGFIDIRAVIVHLSSGEKELLITSLIDQNKYPYKEFKALYGLRWGIEENYKWHKVAYEMENFSGQTQLAIEQEIFSLVFTANLSTLLIQEAQEEIDEDHGNNNLKHSYRINRRIAVAVLKDQLMKGLLDSTTDLEKLCENLKDDLKKNLCPVRPNRKFERKKKDRLKYGCTMRRCI